MSPPEQELCSIRAGKASSHDASLTRNRWMDLSFAISSQLDAHELVMGTPSTIFPKSSCLVKSLKITWIFH